MFKWIDKVYVNARKRVFKNLDTDEILNLELLDDPNNIVKDSETPLSAYCLNMAQQELVDDMSKTHTGTNITAHTVAGAGLTNKVYGFSKQNKTTQNKNICPSQYLNWESGYYETNGGKGDQSSRIRLINLLNVTPSTTYYLNTFLYDHNFIIRTYDNTKTLVRSIGNVNNTSTITTSETECFLGVSIYNSKDTSVTYEYYKKLFEDNELKPFICLKSETDKTYEEFIPNSPSPTYPSLIHCLGSDDVNLFNLELEQGAISGNGVDSVNNTRVRTAGYIELEKGTYAFSYSGGKNAGVYKYDMDNNFIATIVAWTAGSFYFTITEKCKLRFAFMIDNNTTISPNDVTKIKLQKGTVATPWSPFRVWYSRNNIKK